MCSVCISEQFIFLHVINCPVYITDPNCGRYELIYRVSLLIVALCTAAATVFFRQMQACCMIKLP